MVDAPGTAAGKHHTREVFGVFSSAENFENAATDLLVAGYDQRRLSVLAKDDTVEDKLGNHFERVTEIDDGKDVHRTAFVERVTKRETKAMALGALAYVGAVTAAGAVVVTGGTALAAGLTAVAAGGGTAAVGEVLNRAIGESDATQLQRQLDHGGIALWVAVDGPMDEEQAAMILDDNGADSVTGHMVDLSHVTDGNPLRNKAVDPFLKDAKI